MCTGHNFKNIKSKTLKTVKNTYKPSRDADTYDKLCNISTWVVQMSNDTVPCLVATFRVSVLWIPNIEEARMRTNFLDQVGAK